MRTEVPPAPNAPTDATPDIDYALTVDLPEDFALDQPLSPFLLAALELLDPESETYTMDLISMVEATLEDPKQVLRAQERAARDRAMAEMKADGVEYEERLERIQDVTYEKPLEDLLDAAFDKYCQEVPWANDYQLSPKSVLRDMLESASDFKGYIQKLGIARSEGILLRYLAEAYRSLDRTVPIEKRDERLRDIISWLGFVVRSVDSSLVDRVGERRQPGSPRCRAAAGHRRGRGGPPRLHAVGAQRALPPRDPCRPRARSRPGRARRQLGHERDPLAKSTRRLSTSDEETSPTEMPAAPAMFSIDESDEKTAHVWHVHQTLPTRMATTILASWAMSIWTPRKTVARSSSKTTASALSKTCSRTSRTYWNKTKRGRWQYRQRPRFALYAMPYSASSTSYESASAGSSFVSGAVPRASSNAAFMVLLPHVSLRMVRSSAFLLARRRLFSEDSNASLVFCRWLIVLSISSIAVWNLRLAIS